MLIFQHDDSGTDLSEEFFVLIKEPVGNNDGSAPFQELITWPAPRRKTFYEWSERVELMENPTSCRDSTCKSCYCIAHKVGNYLCHILNFLFESPEVLCVCVSHDGFNTGWSLIFKPTKQVQNLHSIMHTSWYSIQLEIFARREFSPILPPALISNHFVHEFFLLH